MLRRPLATVLAAVLAIAAAGCGEDGDEGEGTAAQTGAAARTVQIEGNGDGGGLARVPEIYRKLEPSIVAVLVEGGAGQGEGSGVVVRPDVVVTNAHVVQGAERVRIALASGDRVDAKLAAADRLTDLAVLRVEDRELPAATFADELPEVGSLAVAMGNPLGFENTVTAGIVSGVDRSIPSGGRTPALVGLVQTDAAISPGNSGGALVGPDGRVIGISVAFIPPQARAVSIGFAIPAPTVVGVVEELLDDGRVEHAFLGVALRPLTATIAEALGVETRDGAVVATVEGGGPAGEAGVRPGDIIVQLGDRRVRRVEDVYAALREADPGDRIEATVVRGGDRRRVTVELGERPRQGGG